MQEITELLKDLNVLTLWAVIGASWFFSRRTHFDLEKIKTLIQGIHKEFKFINIRLSRAEGTIYGKEIYEVDEPKQ